MRFTSSSESSKLMELRRKKEVYNKIKEQISRSVNMITRTELNDTNLVKAINTKILLLIQ